MAKIFMNKFKNAGFSLVELTIVLAVLAILSILGGPYFLRLINLARFESAKNHMRDSFTGCINDPNISPSNPYIPGVDFKSGNCSSLMSATIDNSCTISMDMSDGAKTGWDNSYDECTKILSKDEQRHNDYREGADEMIAKYNIYNGNCPVCSNNTLGGDPQLDPEDELYDKAVPIYDPDSFQSNLHMMKAAGLTCESKFIGSNWRTTNNYETEGNYEDLASGYVLLKGSSQEEFRLNAKKMGLRPVKFDVQGERQFLQDHYGRNPEHDNNQDCQIAEVKFNSWDYEFNSRYWGENKP